MRAGARGRRRALGLLALAAALFAVALAVRLVAAGREGPDRWPRPDALEYAEVAASLARGDGYAFPLLGVAMPPRYPPGAPLALLPATLARGGRDAWIGAAVWSALAVVLAAALGHLAGGRLAGAAAAALALCSPLSVEVAGTAMSEGPVQGLAGALLVAAALAARGRSRERGTRALWLAVAGIALAWLALTRLPLVAFALPLAAAVLWPGSPRTGAMHGRASRARAAVVAFVPLAVALVALALLQTELYGAPLRTGYHYWAPIEYVVGAEFVVSTRWLTETWPLPFEQANPIAYGRALLGLDARPPGGALWSTAAVSVAVLGAVSLALRARRCPVARVVLAALVSCAALVAFHLLYFWQEPRFLASLVLPVATCFGQGVAFAARAARRAVARAGARAATASGALACALLLGVALAGPAQRVVERSRWVAARAPGIVASAAALAPLVPDGALLVVDCGSTLAREAFGERVELAFTELTTADGHLDHVRKFGLVNAHGAAPRASALAVLEQPDEDGLAHVRVELARGRAVLLFLSHQHGRPGVGLDLLRAEGVRFERIGTHGTAELFRLAR